MVAQRLGKKNGRASRTRSARHVLHRLRPWTIVPATTVATPTKHSTGAEHSAGIPWYLARSAACSVQQLGVSSGDKVNLTHYPGCTNIARSTIQFKKEKEEKGKGRTREMHSKRVVILITERGTHASANIQQAKAKATVDAADGQDKQAEHVCGKKEETNMRGLKKIKRDDYVSL